MDKDIELNLKETQSHILAQLHTLFDTIRNNHSSHTYHHNVQSFLFGMVTTKYLPKLVSVAVIVIII